MGSRALAGLRSRAAAGRPGGRNREMRRETLNCPLLGCPLAMDLLAGWRTGVDVDQRAEFSGPISLDEPPPEVGRVPERHCDLVMSVENEPEGRSDPRLSHGHQSAGDRLWALLCLTG